MICINEDYKFFVFVGVLLLFMLGFYMQATAFFLVKEKSSVDYFNEEEINMGIQEQFERSFL